MHSSSSTGRLSQFSRWGVLIAAFVISGALLLSAWSSYASVADMSRTLILGQRGTLFTAIRRHLSQLPRPFHEADLAGLQAELAPQGLRYLALMTPTGPVAAGVPAEPAAGAAVLREPPPDGEFVQLIDVGSLVRSIHRAPPGHLPAPGAHPPWPPSGAHRRWPPPDGHRPDGHRPRPGAGGPPPHHRPGLPPLLLEFEPVLAHQLRARAQRTLLINGVIALVVLIGALLAFRWLRRQEVVELKRARERHLATLGEMSAVLAHEIRNPLASLKGHAQLLAEFLPAGKLHEKANRVVRESIRLEQLTTGLLHFVRTGSIDRRACDPVAVARAAVAEVRDSGRHGQAIAIEIERPPSTWHLDPARMQQVLCNLVRNGVQAVAERTSESTDDSAQTCGEPAVSVRVTRAERALRYEIRDLGPGIKSGQEEAIFAPFHTDRVRGTGLGLAVAKRVVEHHGGTICASNHPDGGALFCITIPG